MMGMKAAEATPRLQATCYGETITANSFADLKRKASMIANRYWRPFDKMTVTNNEIGLTGTFYRHNRKYPGNAIAYGQWR